MNAVSHSVAIAVECRATLDLAERYGNFEVSDSEMVEQLNYFVVRLRVIKRELEIADKMKEKIR